MMTDNYPESNLVTNFSNKAIRHKTRESAKVSCPIAPGEGKIPTNIMREDDWDIMAFPHLYPTGKFGLNYQRTTKLTAQQYFLQRLQNIDPRFRNSKPFIFAATYFLERQQLERQINISGQRGTLQENKLLQIEDGFSVFDRVTGTPRYWRNKRYEMIAKLENLGPFHFFFTLSCADKRWEENFVSILAQRGHHVSFKNGSAFINDQPLATYLENENLHDLIKDHVLTVTRNFDRRVHAFIKHIIMGNNQPMHVKVYNYRVEFQVRGAGHIHGVLWLDTDALSKSFPGLDITFSKLKNNEKLTDSDKRSCTMFVDQFITVSLQNDLKPIIEEVQIHRHSRSCRKYGTRCRFGYPRFPSKETILAQPLDKTLFPSESAYKRKLTFLKDILSTVKETLESLEEKFPKQENISILDVLNASKVSEKDYYEALSVSACGTTVILKRSVNEIFVNNYNTEWLRAWNGNLDIQVCFDYYGVVTYITDYMLKAEESEMEFLNEAAKSCAGQPLNAKMKVLAHAFLSHRQMGESEAYYRIMPHMHLTESNVKTIFVSTGFPSKRLSFFSKVSDSENQIEEDADDPQSLFSGRKMKKTIQIENRQGQFTETIPIQTKYASRPVCLEKICLAQFATMYDTIPATQIKGIHFENNASNEEGTIQIITHSREQSGLYLPKFIKLINNHGFMKLRTFPSVLRLHKFNKTTNTHEFFYSELMLYRPWRNETELFESNLELCLSLFNEISEPTSEETKVQVIKTQLFPHMINVEEARVMLETLPSARLQHIADTIDAETQQEHDDQMDEGITLSDEHAIREPTENLLSLDENPTNLEKTMFKHVDISNLDLLYKAARELAPEQKVAFNIMMSYCKSLRKSLSFNSLKPKPPLLKIHGGAGSGKSKLLEVITMWIEHFLRLPNDRQPDQPIVIRAAPTGKAASNIDGVTMHTAFRYNYY